MVHRCALTRYPAVAGLGLLLAAWSGVATGFAETVRLASWNLERSSAPSTSATTNDIRTIVAAVKAMAPDVLLLQGVKDWQQCSQLVQGLKPDEFNLVICSSFPNAASELANGRQVAILSKHKAYFSWAEPWRGRGQGRGGFAFAAVQIGSERVGVSSVLLDETAAPEESVHQILAQRELVRHWEMNQVRTFVVAGTFSAAQRNMTAASVPLVHLLESVGFVDTLALLPLEQQASLKPEPGKPDASREFLFVEPEVFPAPQLGPVASGLPAPVSCVVELDPAKASVAWTARAQEAQRLAQERAASSLQEGPDPALLRNWSAAFSLRWVTTGSIILLLGLAAFVRTRNRRWQAGAPALLPEHADNGGVLGSSYTVVVAGASVTGSSSEKFAAVTSPQPIIHIEAPGPTQTHSAGWQERALQAEQRAEKAQEALRRGMLPHLRRWLKQALVRKLISDREASLETQHEATRKILNVDERLSRIEIQIREQNHVYEQRIEELTCELIAAKEENRELIRARIAQVKAEMEAARARMLADSEKSKE